jgi:translation initiation factor IF-3
VRLIDQEGKQLGILPIREAQRIAQEQDVDLVEVAPGAKPPVCRLLNYGKFIYEKAKKEKLARKSQQVVEIKEIRMRPKTGAHDLAFKTKRVRKFLADGAKVRLRVRFRGRERSYPEIGRDLLARVSKGLEDVAVIEQAPTIEERARSVFMLLAPKPVVRQRDSKQAQVPEKAGAKTTEKAKAKAKAAEKVEADAKTAVKAEAKAKATEKVEAKAETTETVEPEKQSEE